MCSQESESSQTQAPAREPRTAQIFVHLISGRRECINAATLISFRHGQFMCQGGNGVVLRTFDGSEVSFATRESEPACVNVWI